MSLFCRGARFIGYLNAEPKKGDVGWSSRMLSKFGHYNSLQTSDTINISFSDLTWPPDRTDTNTFYSKTSLSIRALSTLFPVRYLPTYGSKALVKWKFPSIGVKSLKKIRLVQHYIDDQKECKFVTKYLHHILVQLCLNAL